MRSIVIRRQDNKLDRLKAAISTPSVTSELFDVESIIVERLGEIPPKLHRLPTIRSSCFGKWYASLGSSILWIAVRGRPCTRAEVDAEVDGYDDGNQFFAHSLVGSALTNQQQITKLKSAGMAGEHGYICKGSLEQLENYLSAVAIRTKANALIVCDAVANGGKVVFRSSRCEVAQVSHVQWNLDHHGNLVPRIWIEPIIIRGAEIKYVSGHNAQFIVDEGIGKGALVRVRYAIGSVPIIDSVLGRTDPDMPAEHYEWHDRDVRPSKTNN